LGINERWQFYNDNLAGVTADTWYIHPGSPNLDGTTAGLASQRNIRLKEISFKSIDGNSQLYEVRAHFRDGTHRWLMVANTYGVIGGGNTTNDEPHYFCNHELGNLAYLAFDIENTHASDTKRSMIGIRFETV